MKFGTREGSPFGGLTLFNERHSDVFVQVQLVGQMGGAVVANGDSERIRVPAGTRQVPESWGVGTLLDPVTCAVVRVFAADSETLLASFGPYGVQCKADGAVHNVTHVVVRTMDRESIGPDYCAVDVRLLYGTAVPVQKYVNALLQPGGHMYAFGSPIEQGSTIAAPDGMHVGIDHNDPASNVIRLATPSAALDDKWVFSVQPGSPARFRLHPFDSASSMTDPSMTAMIGMSAALTAGAGLAPRNELLLVQRLQNVGAGEVLEGWHILCVDDGLLLSSTSNPVQPIQFLAPNAPTAVHQLWNVSYA